MYHIVWFLVSIQLLFRWNVFGAKAVFNMKSSFNTTIVSVELMKADPSYLANLSFNTTIVSVELFKLVLLIFLCMGFNTTIVSVELQFIGKLQVALLRFNTTIVSVEHSSTYNYAHGFDMFQYNYCFGGTWLPVLSTSSNPLFQYNYCFGGTY